MQGQTSIQRWGNSQAVRLPKAALEVAAFGENEKVQIVAEQDQIIIRKLKPRKTLEELFEGFEGEYEFVEADWGEPVGREVL